MPRKSKAREVEDRNTSPRHYLYPLARWVKQRIGELHMSTNEVAKRSGSAPVQLWIKSNYESQGIKYDTLPKEHREISQSFLSQLQDAQTQPTARKWNILVTTLWVLSGEQAHFQMSYEEMLELIGQAPSYPWQQKKHKNVPDLEGTKKFIKVLEDTMRQNLLSFEYLSEHSFISRDRLYAFKDGDVILDYHEIKSILRVKRLHDSLPKKYQGDNLVDLVYPADNSEILPDNIDQLSAQGTDMDRKALKGFFEEFFDSFPGNDAEEIKEFLYEDLAQYSLNKEENQNLLTKAIEGTLGDNEVNSILPLVGERLKALELELKEDIPIENLQTYDADFWGKLLYGIEPPKEQEIHENHNHHANAH